MEYSNHNKKGPSSTAKVYNSRGKLCYIEYKALYNKGQLEDLRRMQNLLRALKKKEAK